MGKFKGKQQHRVRNYKFLQRRSIQIVPSLPVKRQQVYLILSQACVHFEVCFVWRDSSTSNPAGIVEIFETVLRNDITACLTSIMLLLLLLSRLQEGYELREASARPTAAVWARSLQSRCGRQRLLMKTQGG